MGCLITQIHRVVPGIWSGSVYALALLYIFGLVTMAFPMDLFSQGEHKSIQTALSALADVSSPSSVSPPSSPVSSLDPSDLAAFMNAFRNAEVIFAFYVPWCSYCYLIREECEKLSDLLEAASISIPILMVDASQSTVLSNHFGVSVFPTYLMAVNSNKIVYSGHRNIQRVFEWILRNKQNKQNMIPVLPTIAKAIGYIAARDHVVIFFILSIQNLQILESLIELLVAANKASSFAKIIDSTVASHFGVLQTSLIVAKKTTQITYTGSLSDFDSMNNFIKLNSYPTLIPLSPDIPAMMFQDGRPVLILLVDGSSQSNSVTATVLRVSATVSNILFVLCGNTSPLERRMLEFLGHTSRFPAIYLFPTPKTSPNKYRYNFRPTQAMLKLFLSSFRGASSIHSLNKRYITSVGGRPPNTSSTTLIYRIGGETLATLLAAGNRDIVVLFYASWCTNCESFFPIYEKVSQKLAYQENIILTEIDASISDVIVDRSRVNDNPYILFYSKRYPDEPIEYKGPLTLNDFLSFLYVCSSEIVHYDEL